MLYLWVAVTSHYLFVSHAVSATVFPDLCNWLLKSPARNDLPSCCRGRTRQLYFLGPSHGEAIVAVSQASCTLLHS